MWRFCAGALAVLMLVPAVRAQEDAEKKASPAQQFSALVTEHREATNKFMVEYRKAKTTEERQEMMKQYPQPNEYAAKLLELAEKNPDSPVAQQAFSWIFTYAVTSPAATTAAKSVLEKAAANPKDRQSLNNLIMVATRVRPAAKEATELLIEMVESSKDDPAMISPLTSLLSARGAPKELTDKVAQLLIGMLDSRKDDPKLLSSLTTLLSARSAPKELTEKVTQILLDNHVDSDEFAAVCMRLGNPDVLRKVIQKSSNRTVKGYAMFTLGRSLLGRPVKANEEAEKLLAQVVADYGDVEYRGRELGKLAEGPLFELQHLQIGMVAPNIEGADVDDESFQLEDYRGKVVVLDFWGDW